MQVVTDAWWYAIPPLVLSFPAFFVSPTASVACVLLGVAVLGFFRDPERTPPFAGVVSPADGKVSVIREEGPRLRVGVFMNVTNVHVNRAPLPGMVEEVEHVPGSYRPAFSKESDHNERVRIEVDGPDGAYTVILIAGAFARRISPYVEPGDELQRGDRIGHIAFGSRADVLLPTAFDRGHLQVARGETVSAGESIIARAEPTDDSVDQATEWWVASSPGSDTETSPDAESTEDVESSTGAGTSTGAFREPDESAIHDAPSASDRDAIRDVDRDTPPDAVRESPIPVVRESSEEKLQESDGR